MKKTNNKPNLLPSVHPGDVLREEFMKPLGLSAYATAKGLGVSAITVSLMIRRKRNISPEMALRLARWSGCTADFWMGLQAQHDREAVQRQSGERIEREVTPLQLAA